MYAITASINKLWWTTYDNNLIIHLDLSLHQCKNLKFTASAYIYSSKDPEKKHLDTNGRYKTNDNQVAVSESATCSYENSRFEDLLITLPGAEIHPMHGTNTYYIKVLIWYNDQVLTREWVNEPFEITGPLKGDIQCSSCNGTGRQICPICGSTGSQLVPQVNFYTHQTYWQYVSCSWCGGSGYKRCLACNGEGLFREKIYITHPSNHNHNSSTPLVNPYYNINSGSMGSGSSSSTSTYIPCSRCGGTGICKSCGGQRGRWEYVDGYTGSGAKSFINCGECNGSGKCPICYGRGKL